MVTPLRQIIAPTSLGLTCLTPCQARVLSWGAQGKTNSAIRGHSGAKGRIVTGVVTGTADSDTCLRKLGWPIAVSGSS